MPLSVTIKDRNFSLASHSSLIEQRLGPARPPSQPPATPFRERGRRRPEGIGLMSSSAMSPQVKRKHLDTSTLCFPNESVVDTSRLETTRDRSNGGASVPRELVSPPAKRTRLSDVTSLNMSVTSMRRLSRFMTAEAITILSTPNITR